MLRDTFHTALPVDSPHPISPVEEGVLSFTPLTSRKLISSFRIFMGTLLPICICSNTVL